MNNTLSKYIEKIRISRNLTREKFVDGILSERQYRRYLKGESSMPNEKVNQLVTRLGIDLFDFYLNFIEESEIQTQKLKTLFNTIRVHDYDKANMQFSKIDLINLDSKYQKQYYNFCRIYLDVVSNKLPKHVGYDEILSLIDYPNILNHDVINFIELVALETVSKFIFKNKKDDRAIEYLNLILTKDGYELKGVNFMILPSIYANISQFFLTQEAYEKAIILIQKGLSHCKKYETYNSMANLLYYKAYYYKKTFQSEIIPSVVKELQALLLLEGNDKKTEYYNKNIKNNFQ